MLRGIATLLVVQVHFLNNLIVRDVLESNIVTDFFKIWGDFGVDIFFVISGFVMAKSLENTQSFWSFLLRRFYRIYPLYFISVIVLLVIHLLSQSGGLSPLLLFQTFVLFPTFDQSHIAMFLGPAWTLCFELLFYFCCSLSFLPLIARMKSRLIFLVILLIFLSLIISSLFMMFIYGVMCWKCSRFLTFKKTAILIILLFVVYIYGYKFFDLSLHTQLNPYRWLYFGIPALITVLITSLLNLRNSFLEYIGEISYSIYLSHMALTVHLYGKLAEYIYLPLSGHLVVIILSSVLVGMIFYELFERPMLRKLLNL